MISGSVLDSSALIAYMRGEPGRPVVARAIAQGTSVSLLNWAEVLTKFRQWGQEPEAVMARFRSESFLNQNVQFVSLVAADSVQIAKLWPFARAHNLSLGDRACLALGLRLRLPVLHAEHRWEGLDIGVRLQNIR